MAAEVPCALCRLIIILSPDEKNHKKITHFARCGCPSPPLICGYCRNRKVRYTCLWCNYHASGASIRSPQQASHINAVAKRWETFRTHYPCLSPLSENWCNFVRYDQLMQQIQTFTKNVGLTD